MDKFDESIKNAKVAYEPSSNFVERTMQKITGRRLKRRWSLKLWTPVMAGGVALIAIVIILPLGSHTTTGSNTSSGNSTTNQGQPAPSAQSAQSTTNASGSTAAGTDNTSLTNDLNSIDSSTSQESKDQSAANNAMNDQSQEVTIPTS